MKKSELKSLIKEVIQEMGDGQIEKPVDKRALHNELLTVKKEIEEIMSYVRYGQTLSGSHLADLRKVGDLRLKVEEILSSLKSTQPKK